MRYHLQTWVKQNAPKLAGYAKDFARPALSVGKGAVSLTFSLVTIFALVILMLLEGPKMRRGVLGMMAPDRAGRHSAIARQVNRSVTGYMLGDFATSVIAGLVVLVTLLILGVPFAGLWALWVGLVDFLPMIGGALAGIPVILFAFTHSVTAGIATLVVFLVYTQVENHVLNPIIMSRTVRINPLLVLVSILVGASIGSWVGGIFGGFVAALLAIPLAGAGQVIVREVWQSTAPSAADTPGQAASPEPRGDPGVHRTGPADVGPLPARSAPAAE
jgi:predicted PurR-regulated permease PerM